MMQPTTPEPRPYYSIHPLEIGPMLRRQAGESAAMAELVRIVWRARSAIYALADVGEIPVFDMRTGEASTVPRSSAEYDVTRALYALVAQMPGVLPVLVRDGATVTILRLPAVCR